MDKIFKPDQRKWISPLINLKERAKIMQLISDTPAPLIPGDTCGLEFVPPPPPPEPMETREFTSKLKDVQNVVDLIVKPKDPKEDGGYCDMDEVNASLANLAQEAKEFDSLNIDYSGSESGSDDEGGLTTSEDDSNAESDDEEEKDETSILDNPDGMNGLPTHAVELVKKIKSIKRDPESPDRESSTPGTAGINEILAERDRKQDAEFATFYAYNIEKARQRSRDAIYREEYLHLGMLKSSEYVPLARRTSSLLAFDKHEVMVDDCVSRQVEMPLLAGPVPHKAIRKLTTLALYTSLSDEPGNFQWKSTHVMEQLTASQQAEKQLMRQYQRQGDRMKKKFPSEDFILTVSFYQPSELATYDLKSSPEPKPGLEIEVLGSHTLDDLRQLFFCQRNYACTKECNEFKKWTTIDEAMERFEDDLAMKVCKGDVMYINECCYTDGSEEAQTHFKSVRSWIEGVANAEIGGYLPKFMSETKISDLEIRFGYPYMYLHQGDCEHIIVFNAMRLPRPVEFTTFPRHEVTGKYTTKFCRIDKEFMARWIVCGSDRFPEDPILLCNSCVEEYCFKKPGNSGQSGAKVGNFKLFPFLQITAFV